MSVIYNGIKIGEWRFSTFLGALEYSHSPCHSEDQVSGMIYGFACANCGKSFSEYLPALEIYYGLTFGPPMGLVIEPPGGL